MENEKTTYKQLVSASDAARMRVWMLTRGGLQVWKSINMSNPDSEWLTPALQPDGTPTTKPNWQAANAPALVLTDPGDVGVVTLVEFKRFHVAIRPASNGLGMKLTDASTEKLNKALRQAGLYSTYAFDYDTQEAVVYKAGDIVSLATWEG